MASQVSPGVVIKGAIYPTQLLLETRRLPPRLRLLLQRDQSMK